MTYEITASDNVSILGVSFVDEGIDLTDHIKVDGDEQKALAYLPFFVADLKRNYAHLFPQPIVDPSNFLDRFPPEDGGAKE